MNAYNRYKNRLERFLQTERGKRFINFAYSIGAAIVILGAMFKLLHFPFGNQMLFIGMMTEVVVFILSAFDRPVQDYAWEEVFPVLTSRNPNDRPDLRSTSLHQREEIPTHSRVQDTAPRDWATGTEEYKQQMESMNRTLSGLNSLYELQLKSLSTQIGTMEQINQGLSRLRTAYGDALPEGTSIKDETRRMAEQLKELNEVYARMLQAMTTNRGSSPE